MMKTTALLIAALLVMSGAALAENPLKVDNDAPTPLASRADCITDGYDCYPWGTGTMIPDNDPAGVVIGPLATSPGATIQDVILFLNMTHTWIGDLIVELWYDYDCDGTPETYGGVLCRSQLADCPTDGCCGCSGNLAGLYGFDDTVASIEDVCPGDFPQGCYGPDYDSAGLDVFDGLETGGCFWLYVIDGAGGDVGEVMQWSVCVLAEPIAQEGALDIKPESCPNPFNVKAQGQLPVAVLGTADFDVALIDVETLTLEGTVEPIWHRYGDVATPVGPDAEPCECTELGPDGYMDLKLKFLRQDIVDAMGPVEDGDMVELTLTGELMDGTPFTLSDCVWIIDKTKDVLTAAGNSELSNTSGRANTEPETWSTIKALYR